MGNFVVDFSGISAKCKKLITLKYDKSLKILNEMISLEFSLINFILLKRRNSIKLDTVLIYFKHNRTAMNLFTFNLNLNL